MPAGIHWFLCPLSLTSECPQRLFFDECLQEFCVFCTVYIPLQMSLHTYNLKDICRQSLLATIIIQAAWRLIFERGPYEKLHICFMLRFATSLKSRFRLHANLIFMKHVRNPYMFSYLEPLGSFSCA